MIVGLTYDLRQDYLDLGYSEEETAEFDRVDTIDAIDRALQSLGYKTDRIGNIRSLTKRLARGDRWDLVFNIAEGLYGIGREAQVPALLDAYNIPYTFSDPLVLSLTLHKGLAKRVLRDLGIPTPDFVEICSEEDIEKVKLPYPLFAKPIAEGTGKGINSTSKINNKNELRDICRQLLVTYKQPVLVETYLPGREFTVAIIGTGQNARVIGSMEVVLKGEAELNAYSFHNKENYEELVEYRRLVDEEGSFIKKLALDAWLSLNCRDAGRIDIREAENGTPSIIDINPLAGLRPDHSDLCIICQLEGLAYIELIQEILESAIRRMKMGASF